MNLSLNIPGAVQSVFGRIGAVVATIGDYAFSQISGKAGLSQGGTNVDLSASGSSTAFLAQDASHVVSARSIVAADVPNLDASKITTGTLALARGGTNADLSASGSSTAVLAQDASHVVTARSLVAADIPSLSATYQVLTGKDAASGYAGLDANIMLKPAEFLLTINAQTGTSYTFLDSDRGKIVTFSNAAAIAVTLPQAGASSSFVSGWYCYFKNIGASTVTVTPTTSTVETAAKMIIPPGASGLLLSDGSNYILPMHTVDRTAAGGTYIADLNADMVLYGAAVAIVSTGNAVIGFTVNIDKAFILNKIAARATGNTSGSSQTFDMGIYDSQGNKILGVGAQTVINGNAANLNATTTATLFLPGAYKYVWTCSATTVTFVGGQANLVGGQNAGTTAAAINANFIKLFSAANAPSSGVLPTTLGVLTSALAGGDTSGNVPTMLFET